MRIVAAIAKSVCALLVGAAMLGPSRCALATENLVNEALQVRDVELAQGGVLRGVMTDRSGAPLAHQPVSLRRDGRLVAETATEISGHFEVLGLSGGLYQLSVGPDHSLARLWSPGTAPDAAVEEILLVAPAPLTRGQGTGVTPGLTLGALGSAAIAGGLIYSVVEITDPGSGS